MAQGQPKALAGKLSAPQPRAGFGFSSINDDLFLLIGGASRDEGHYDDFWYLKIEPRNQGLQAGWKQLKDFES